MAAETGASSNSLLQQLEEEARSNRKLAQEQILEEVDQLKERIEMVQSLPRLARSEADLAKLREELVRSFSTLIRCSSCCVCNFFPCYTYGSSSSIPPTHLSFLVLLLDITTVKPNVKSIFQIVHSEIEKENSELEQSVKKQNKRVKTTIAEATVTNDSECSTEEV